MPASHSRSDKNRTVFTVSELNHSVADMLETEYSWVWVEGEISNLAKPASGHVYFTLKDASAQIRCALFKSRKREQKFKPENGSKIILRGKVGLYTARGDYQIIVDRMEQAGDGLLQRQFEALKQKLALEGLFEQDIKQPIPEHPESIGIITSRSGAALQDVLSVVKRRFPALPVKFLAVPVQGNDAAAAICHAIHLMDKHKTCDVLLLVRGGGSLEDLQAFNEESVARAIFKCKIPVVSGVGHEIDFTIADFVADFRAATPTAAAEKVTTDQHVMLQISQHSGRRILQLINEKISFLTTHNRHLQKRLQQKHPVTVLHQLSQRLDDFDQRMALTWKVFVTQMRNSLLQSNTQLIAVSPAHRITNAGFKLKHNWQQMRLLMKDRLHQRGLKLGDAAATLNALSPLQTLSRGYSITCDVHGRALTRATGLNIGQTIKTRLHESNILSIIKVIKD